MILVSRPDDKEGSFVEAIYPLNYELIAFAVRWFDSERYKA